MRREPEETNWEHFMAFPLRSKTRSTTAGIISTAGTLGRANFVPKTDATVVRRLRDAGAIVVGKTNTPELTLAPQTDNLVYGRTNNPYDLERTPGGSSGGSAAIVAAGGSALDIGSDTGGSIRVPAHFTGIAGIRPTAGRVPRTGHIIGFEDALEALTTLGPLARHVEDLETVLRLISGPDGKDAATVDAVLRQSRRVNLAILRLAFYVDDGTDTSSDATIAVIKKAADELAPVVAEVEERRPRALERAGEIMARIFEADGGARIQRILKQAGTENVHPWLARFLEGQTEDSAIQAYEAIQSWATYRSEMLAFFEDFDVILCPVVGHAAPYHAKSGEVPDERGWYTMAYSLTGWPVVVVRVGTSPVGLPIGLQVVAPPWREDIALAVARELETMLGGYEAPSL